MINSLILALGLIGQCSTGNCQVGDSYVQSYYQPAYGYYQPVYVEPSLHLIILNVPGGQERTRSYAKCKIYDKFYNIPVINKVLPAVTRRTDYELVLNYGNGVPFKYSLYGDEEYINYGSSVKKEKGPMAVKDFDTTPVQEEVSKVKSGPSGLKHPDSLPPKPTIQKSTLPSNEEIDALLKKPSTVVPAENSLFPRY